MSILCLKIDISALLLVRHVAYALLHSREIQFFIFWSKVRFSLIVLFLAVYMRDCLKYIEFKIKEQFWIAIYMVNHTSWWLCKHNMSGFVFLIFFLIVLIFFFFGLWFWISYNVFFSFLLLFIFSLFFFFVNVVWILFHMLEQPQLVNLCTWEFHVLLWPVLYTHTMLVWVFSAKLVSNFPFCLSN